MKRVMPIKSQRKGFPTVLAFVLALLTILSAANVALAATAAGSVIRNQASATYKTDDGIERFATSNVVETVVRQVAGFQIFQTQTDYTNAGGQLVFPHLINNIGNGPDSIILTAEQFVSDDFNFLSVEIFADADHDGKPDNLTPISSTPELLPNEAYTIVAIVNVPNDIEAGKVGKVRIRGRSTLDNTVTKSNVNTAIVKTGAIISISKKMSITEGDASSGTFTITLNYRNDGTSTATDFVLMDPLPIDMTYVPNSGRWSDTESTVLTDSNPTDVQLGDTTSIIYCAYVPSCIDLPESVRDGDTLVSNQVTAIIADVPPGRSGTLTFQARIRPNRAAKTVQNVAEFEYKDGATDIARAFSNFASFKIASTRNVVANGSAVDSANATAEPVNVITASQGSTVSFANYIWNSGNDTDRFDLVIDTAGSNFPPGTVFQLFREDGATPLLDSSGNGVPDTGPVESNTNVNVFLRATLPPDAVGNNAGAGYTVSLRAISTNNPNAFDDVINKLDSITPGSVDLTNNAAAGASGALGEGIGPETDALVNNEITAGNTTRFELHLSNIGTSPDDLVLSASTDSSFATETLPTGWSVTFKNSDDTEITNSSGPLAVGNTVRVFADVSVPATQTPLVQSLYFRALSPTTGVVDIVHNAITIADAGTLLIEPSGIANIEAGGAFVYSHRIENTGNTSIGPITLSTSDSLAAEGWSSEIYADSDADGAFSAADTRLATLPTIPPNGVVNFFVKVITSTAVASSSSNTTTVTASWNAGSDTASVENLTTISAGDIVITKEQAPDLGCNGTLDSPYTLQAFSVEPGNNCVRYRLIATNSGVTPALNVVIDDATPPFTSYQPAAACSAVGCIIEQPAAGETGAVSATMPSLQPGDSVEFTFSVKIE